MRAFGFCSTNNVLFSTPCTPDYGDCGCDNCKGEFEDISTRMDEFADWLFTLGWDRTKAVWTVPQAFGGSSYVLFSTLSCYEINHNHAPLPTCRSKVTGNAPLPERNGLFNPFSELTTAVLVSSLGMTLPQQTSKTAQPPWLKRCLR